MGWSRWPESTVASHCYNTRNADSISAIWRWKTGCQRCNMWRNHMWADESWSQQTAFPPTERLRLTSLHSFVSFISIHVHAHSAAAAAAAVRTLTEAESAAIPSKQLPLPLNYSSRLLLLMERQWRQPGHSTPHKHLFMSYWMEGNWQAFLKKWHEKRWSHLIHPLHFFHIWKVDLWGTQWSNVRRHDDAKWPFGPSVFGADIDRAGDSADSD